MNNKQLQTKIVNLIEQCTSHLPYRIRHFTRLNQPIKIIDDSLAEVIHAELHQTTCTGSGGSGWDTVDYGESKSSSHVQSRKCLSCGKKNSFFHSKCSSCGGKLGNNPRDGRWGIRAKSHIEYYDDLLEYRLMLIEPVTNNPSCRNFRIRNWVIKKDAEHLNNYAKAQYNIAKSDQINFQPLKGDFYLCDPIKLFDLELVIGDNNVKVNVNFFDINNKQPEQRPEKYKNLISENVISAKKFGKERGTVKRQ